MNFNCNFTVKNLPANNAKVMSDLTNNTFLKEVFELIQMATLEGQYRIKLTNVILRHSEIEYLRELGYTVVNLPGNYFGLDWSNAK